MCIRHSLCPDLRMGDVDPGERNRIFQDWRARGAGDHADLGAANMDTVTVADKLVALHLKADKLPLRVLAPADQRLAADEVLVLPLQRHGEADTRLERVGLIAELIAGKDQAGLDAYHVERLQPEWHQPMRLTGLPPRVEYG